jgi:hypothetical protein
MSDSCRRALMIETEGSCARVFASATLQHMAGDCCSVPRMREMINDAWCCYIPCPHLFRRLRVKNTYSWNHKALRTTLPDEVQVHEANEQLPICGPLPASPRQSIGRHNYMNVTARCIIGASALLEVQLLPLLYTKPASVTNAQCKISLSTRA